MSEGLRWRHLIVDLDGTLLTSRGKITPRSHAVLKRAVAAGITLVLASGRNYLPDFIARVDDGHGQDDLLNLIIEVSGKPKKDKPHKVETAKTLWVPTVNNHGGFGRWEYIEITDIDNAKNDIRNFIGGITL